MYHINITFMYKHSIQHICQIKICLFNNWSPKPIGPPLVDLEVERAFRRDDAAAAVREAYLQPHKPVVDLLAREQNLAFENISGGAHSLETRPRVRAAAVGPFGPAVCHRTAGGPSAMRTPWCTS